MIAKQQQAYTPLDFHTPSCHCSLFTPFSTSDLQVAFQWISELSLILHAVGDLYRLGFIPEGAPDPLQSGLVEPLSRILKQLSQGGGAKEINIEEVRCP